MLALLAVGALSNCISGNPQPAAKADDSNSKGAVEDHSAANEAPVPPVPPAKPVNQLDPKRLVGMSEGQVTELIGTPKEVRDEPPALVWRYTGDSCFVDVLFYFDLTRQEFRALAYRFDSNGRTDQAQRTCLGGIQEAQRGSKP
jgi:hypothetical protein